MKHILSFILFTLLFISNGCTDKIKAYNVKKHFEEVKSRMPLYLKISDGKPLPPKKEEIYIGLVQNSSPYEASYTYGEVVKKAFPMIPLEFRRWECYKYKGEVYVCYVLKSYATLETSAFIWKIKGEPRTGATVIPFNAAARLANIACYGNKGMEYAKLCQSLPPKERKIVEHYEERAIYYESNTACLDILEKKILKQFGITQKELDKAFKDLDKLEESINR